MKSGQCFVSGGVRRMAKETNPVLHAGDPAAERCVTGNPIKRAGAR